MNVSHVQAAGLSGMVAIQKDRRTTYAVVPSALVYRLTMLIGKDGNEYGARRTESNLRCN